MTQFVLNFDFVSNYRAFVTELKLKIVSLQNMVLYCVSCVFFFNTSSIIHSDSAFHCPNTLQKNKIMLVLLQSY